MGVLLAFTPSFSDARITNQLDVDGDGYARILNIEFKVNSNITGQYYVKVYESDILFDDYLKTSSTFTVNGNANDYQKVTLYADNYPGVGLLGHGTAEFRLDLYDAATNTLVQTWHPSNDPDLNNVLVELSSEDTGTLPSYTTEQIINQLITSWVDGISTIRTWNVGTVGTVTFGINTAAPTNASGYTPSEVVVTMPESGIKATQLSFKLWDDLVRISFVFIESESGGENANITVNYTDNLTNSAAWGYVQQFLTNQYQTFTAGQVWVGSNNVAGVNPYSLGSYNLMAMQHEIGHALGLSHPGMYNAAPGVTINYIPDAVFAQDTQQYSIMSYFGRYDFSNKQWTTANDHWTTANPGLYPQTPMVYDIAAIQSLYGFDTTTRIGNTTYGYGFESNLDANDIEKTIYDFSTNLHPIFSIWDAGGIDTLDASKWTGGDQTLNLTPGSYSSILGMSNNIGIAFGTVIENAIGGSGNDTISGNNANNTLSGNDGNDNLYGGSGNNYLSGGAGNDTLDGGTGTDTLIGGAGNDTYLINTSRDLVVETFNNGIDSIQASIAITNRVSFLGKKIPSQFAPGPTLATPDNVENLSALGFARANLIGNDLDNELTGNAADNVLKGMDGNDILIGGWGRDTLYGGSGNDIIDGGSGQDRLIGGTGSDTFVFSAPSDSSAFSLPDVITDFEPGTDKIDLSAIDAASGGVDDTFLWGGNNVHTVANSVTWYESGVNTIIRIDNTGDTAAEMQITLSGTGLGLLATDFIL